MTSEIISSIMRLIALKSLTTRTSTAFTWLCCWSLRWARSQRHSWRSRSCAIRESWCTCRFCTADPSRHIRPHRRMPCGHQQWALICIRNGHVSFQWTPIDQTRVIVDQPTTTTTQYSVFHRVTAAALKKIRLFDLKTKNLFYNQSSWNMK